MKFGLLFHPSVSVYTKMEKMVKNTATTIPSPQNTTQHLLRIRVAPIHTPGPPFNTHTPKTFRKLALNDNTTRNHSKPPEFTRTPMPIHETLPTPLFRAKSQTTHPLVDINTHTGVRAHPNSVCDHHITPPTTNDQPTRRQTGPFPSPTTGKPTQTDAPRLTPSYHHPPRLLQSHREQISQPHPPPVSPHIPLISPTHKVKDGHPVVLPIPGMSPTIPDLNQNKNLTGPKFSTPYSGRTGP